MLWIYILLINVLSANIAENLILQKETTDTVNIDQCEYKIILTGNKQLGMTKVIDAVTDAIKYSKQNLRQNIIDQLMQTDLFIQVDVKINDNVITIHVVENPFVKNIKYTGANVEQISQQQNLFEITGLDSFHLLSDAQIEAGIDKLTSFYYTHLGQIVQAEYHIDENNDLQIKLKQISDSLITDIVFINNTHFTRAELLAIIPGYNILTGINISVTALQHQIAPQIIKKYKNAGFLDCHLVSIKIIPINHAGTSRAVIIIDENKRYVIDHCVLNFTKDIDQDYMTRVISIFNEYRNKDAQTKWSYLDRLIKNLSAELIQQADYLMMEYKINKKPNNKAELAINIKQKTICIQNIHITTGTLDKNTVLKILKIHPGQYTTKYYLLEACRNAQQVPCIKEITFELIPVANDSTLYDLSLNVTEAATFKVNPLNGGFPRRPEAQNKTVFSYNPLIFASNILNTYTIYFYPSFSWGNFLGSGNTVEVSLGVNTIERDHLDSKINYIINKINTFDGIGKKIEFSRTARSNLFTGLTTLTNDSSESQKHPWIFDKIYDYFYPVPQSYSSDINISTLKLLERSLKFTIDFDAYKLPVEISLNFKTYKYIKLTYYNKSHLPNDNKLSSRSYVYDFVSGYKTSTDKKTPDDIQRYDKQQMNYFIDRLSKLKLIPAKNVWLVDLICSFNTHYDKPMYFKFFSYIPEVSITPFICKTQHHAVFRYFFQNDQYINLIMTIGSACKHNLFRSALTKIGSIFKPESYTDDEYIEYLDRDSVKMHYFYHYYGPYNTETDNRLPGKYLLSIDLYYVNKYNEYISLFGGIKFGSCWGYDDNKQLDDKIKKQSDDTIEDKTFRLRTSLIIGTIVALPILGKMQIGLNIPLINVYIFGYDIGYNIQRDDLSFIIFSPSR